MLENQIIIKSRLVIGSRDKYFLEFEKTLDIPGKKIRFQKYDHLRSQEDMPEYWWSVDYEAENATCIEESLEELLKIIWPIRDRLKQYFEMKLHLELFTEFACNVLLRGDVDMPLLEVTPSMMEKLLWFKLPFLLSISDYRDK